MYSSRDFIWVVTPLGFVCKKMNSSVITQTVPLECTHWELSFEWSHLKVSLDSSGFRSFLGWVKFTFGSERIKKCLLPVGRPRSILCHFIPFQIYMSSCYAKMQISVCWINKLISQERKLLLTFLNMQRAIKLFVTFVIVFLRLGRCELYPSIQWNPNNAL